MENNKYTCVCVYIYTYIYVCVCVCVCMYTYLYLSVYTHTYTYVNKKVNPPTNQINQKQTHKYRKQNRGYQTGKAEEGRMSKSSYCD